MVSVLYNLRRKHAWLYLKQLPLLRLVIPTLLEEQGRRLHLSWDSNYSYLFFSNFNFIVNIAVVVALPSCSVSTVARLLHFWSQTFNNALCFSLYLPFVFIVFLATLMTIWLQKCSNLATVSVRSLI